MEQGQYSALHKFVESDQFTLFVCVSYIAKYADNIGVHHFLCQKLRTQFKLEEIMFFIPQLCQILVTVETESMALEDLLLELSQKNCHFSLTTFWYLQSHLTDLAQDPNSFAFQSARRVLNQLQYILFAIGSPPTTKFRENVAPSVVMSSLLAATMGFPQLNSFAEPLVKSQGRQQKSFIFEIAKNFKSKLTENLTLKNTKSNSRLTSNSSSSAMTYETIRKTSMDESYRKEAPRPTGNENKAFDFSLIDEYTDDIINKDKRFPRKKSLITNQFYEQEDLSTASTPAFNNELNSYSLPDLKRSITGGSAIVRPPSPTESVSSTPGFKTNPLERGRLISISGSHGANVRNISPSIMSTTSKIKLLKSNYFRCETQFAIALQTISIRLSQVPKEARLSALRAELSLMNRDLPAEVDVPFLLPNNRKGKLHRIVQIAANEAAVLNSAERVPFLLLIEYLSDDLDFDPDSEINDRLLHEKPNNSYIFDLGIQTNKAGVAPMTNASSSYYNDKPSETDLGDLSVVQLSNNRRESELIKNEVLIKSAQKIPIIDNETKRNVELNFQSSYDQMPSSSDSKGSDDIATQMRIASMMLNQLDSNTSTLPLDQSAAIKARIIASMQSLQDQFGYKDIEAIHGEAGERKLENDLKLGSSTYLGEDWQTKKERIRKSSKYGHLPNWDLTSVIAKTGDDLRQEAFATQVIQAMSQIWKTSKVDVWVKRMRILITSNNTGLVETITNALSIHSIKKELTKLSIESGDNPKGNISTIIEHFERVFGDKDSPKYKRAQANFAKSLAAASVMCYLLQIKDRHNGNIMLDNEGHLIHIDFGFLLSNSPGSVGFEAAPFKLPFEYVELLGGLEGDPFLRFKQLTKDAFRELRKHEDSLVNMVELMQRDSTLPCFKAGAQTSVQFRQRFQSHLNDQECDDFVENVLIAKSIGSLYTRLYDQFQLMTQGIYS
ncbi:hypothetical protein WICPIJ_006793 [Wickerhamomyces pijperi]|uniref:1-phosphatidylinositol 4-kinase n=1 Tax=Wickerhamomyces pijperi TaxID=599730 RepID=A0A9P8TKN7_WICPI|nr:hypothetical protein WICPIJ_006793 [Wickerhamomyces pijperi]